MIASSGISTRLWRLYAQAWLVCLAFPILDLAGLRASPARFTVAAFGLLLYVALYTWIMWPHPLREPDSTTSTRFASLLAVLAVLTLALSLAFGAAFLWLLVGLSAAVGVVLSARQAFWTTMALTLLTLGMGVWLSGGLARTDWLQLIPLVLLVRGLGLDMAGLNRLAAALHDLNAARDELARQAVTEERLRVARDLHDLLGHSLSLIALKSELAGRLIDADPTRAAQEVRELEQAARQALRDVREAVAGYRQPTLQGELEAARQLMAAAGISVTIEAQAGELNSTMDAILAWTVREGVTNVIRHSRARHCTVRLSRALGVTAVEIIDDGHGERAPDLAPTGDGHGLTGLAERAQSLGGRLQVGRQRSDGTPGYCLRLEIPEAAQVSPGQSEQ